MHDRGTESAEISGPSGVDLKRKDVTLFCCPTTSGSTRRTTGEGGGREVRGRSGGPRGRTKKRTVQPGDCMIVYIKWCKGRELPLGDTPSLKTETQVTTYIEVRVSSLCL